MLKWNYFKEFENVLVFYFNMEPRLKWNKIVLAAKTILFRFRRGFMLKWNYSTEFQTWAPAIGHPRQNILYFISDVVPC